MAVRLATRAPFDGGALIAFLAPRAVPGVEEVRGATYRRSLRLVHGAATVELRATEPGVEVGAESGTRPATGAGPATEAGAGSGPDLGVEAAIMLDDPRDLDEAARGLRALLDLDADPDAVRDALGRDELIGHLVRAAPGRRVAGHVDPHELAVRAVLGQQVSLAAAAGLAARLVAEHGRPLVRPSGTVTHLFPSARALAGLAPNRLPMPRSRAAALVALAGALASGHLVLDRGADRDEAWRGLLALPGIGPWTASYVAMRALGDSDAFPADDLGIRHALERMGRRADPAASERLAERWRPYRAYAAEHLWASVPGP